MNFIKLCYFSYLYSQKKKKNEQTLFKTQIYKQLFVFQSHPFIIPHTYKWCPC